MQKYSHMKNEGLLFTIGDSSTPDFIGGDAQNNSSIYGKIIFKKFSNQDNFIIISKGHRNPQGLLVDDNNIISTEHGPRGGDEINRIAFGKNWLAYSLLWQFIFQKGFKIKKVTKIMDLKNQFFLLCHP